jgi:ubiquinone/menaquinone biosynthesis C-methylase UbiE
MPFATKNISAYEAMYEAQKIAYAPVIFQVVRALRDLGILSLLEQSGKLGMSAIAISEALEISTYGVEILLESGLSCNVVEYQPDTPEAYSDRVYVLSKVGYYILNDTMTRTNMDFNHYVCYQGFADLDKSIVDGKPRGLEVFGKQWKTFYEALPHLPDNARNSWYAFDHYYSDLSYPLVIPIVLEDHPKTILDIGANIGKFAILLAQSDPQVEITMVDLPDQLEVAQQHVELAGVSDRINAMVMDALDTELQFPVGLDVYWMSQFLSCFGRDEVVSILSRVGDAMIDESRLFIMETCWDRQKHEAAAFSLVNTSPYFTCIASGNSKMYHSEELLDCIEKAGLEVVKIYDDLSICHSMFECRSH